MVRFEHRVISDELTDELVTLFLQWRRLSLVACLNQQQRYRRSPHHPIGNAAQQPTAQSRLPSRGHYDQVDPVFFGKADDFDIGLAHNGCRLGWEALIPKLGGDAL